MRGTRTRGVKPNLPRHHLTPTTATTAEGCQLLWGEWPVAVGGVLQKQVYESGGVG
ncbi:hypothetical protein [Mycobacterium botniense]|uniref:hypothetical protein n=1 Tax=Mycobacterium botniense TaxID=84962 RepID=UPI0013D75AEA|nr:hypothetical protein [Mycobacterium botniense]